MPRPQLTLYPAPSQPYLYLPPNWDAGWKAAKAAAAARPIGLLLLGDSIAAGCYSNNGATTVNWAQGLGMLITSALQARFGHYGDHWGACTTNQNPGGPGYYSAAWSTAVSNLLGPCGSPPSQASLPITFTTPYACTALDIIYIDSGAWPGSWVYNLDGGSNQTITLAANWKIQKIPFSALANTTHTVTFVSESGTPSLILTGINTYVPGQSTGLYTAHFEASGYALTSLNLNPSIGWSGLSNLSSYPVGCDLIIIELSANDINTQQNTTTFAQTADQLIRYLRRGRPNASILFIITSYPNANGSASPAYPDDCYTTLAHPETAYSYHQILYQLAQLHGCALLDIHTKWGATPTAQGFMNANIHPTLAGHVDIANAALALL